MSSSACTAYRAASRREGAAGNGSWRTRAEPNGVWDDGSFLLSRDELLAGSVTLSAAARAAELLQVVAIKG